MGAFRAQPERDRKRHQRLRTMVRCGRRQIGTRQPPATRSVQSPKTRFCCYRGLRAGAPQSASSVLPSMFPCCRELSSNRVWSRRPRISGHFPCLLPAADRPTMLLPVAAHFSSRAGDSRDLARLSPGWARLCGTGHLDRFEAVTPARKRERWDQTWLVMSQLRRGGVGPGQAEAVTVGGRGGCTPRPRPRQLLRGWAGYRSGVGPGHRGRRW